MTTNTSDYPSIRTDALIEKAYQEAHDPERAAKSEENIIFGAWIAAIAVPIVGFALGTILTARQRETHGIWAMVVSTASACAWWGLIAALRG